MNLRRVVGMAILLVLAAAGCSEGSFDAGICQEAGWHMAECYGHFEVRLQGAYMPDRSTRDAQVARQRLAGSHRMAWSRSVHEPV